MKASSTASKPKSGIGFSSDTPATQDWKPITTERGGVVNFFGWRMKLYLADSDGVHNCGKMKEHNQETRAVRPAFLQFEITPTA